METKRFIYLETNRFYFANLYWNFQQNLTDRKKNVKSF